MSPLDSGSDRSPRPQPRLPRPPLEGELPAASEFLECEAVALDIVAYFDGEAGDAVALRARRHLDACRECARMWRDWGDTRLLLRTAHVPAPPAHWPASLVQRARLHALLPSLFTPTLAEEERPLEPLGSLRENILARTTRAPGPANLENAVQEADGVDKRLSHASEAREQLGKWSSVRTYALPALGAWVLVLSMIPAPEPLSPPQSPSLDISVEEAAATRSASDARAPSALARAPRDAAAPTRQPKPALRAPAVGAQPRSSALPASPASNAQAPAVAAPSEGPEARRENAAVAPTAAVTAAKPGVAASEAASVVDPASTWRAARTEPAGTTEAGRVPEAPRKRVLIAALPDLRQRAGRGLTRRAPAISMAASDVLSARRSESARSQPSRLATGFVARPLSVSLDASVSGGMSAAMAENASLSVARDLNDARPDEIGEAIDAYAATWMDEDDFMLQ